MKDGKFQLSDIRVSSLSKVYKLEDFDCSDPDLNEFLRMDSFAYQDAQITNVYLLIYGESVIGFFSLQNDSVKLVLDEKSHAKIIKPHTEYPAVKIGRLGIDKRYQRKGLGKLIIQIAIGIVREAKRFSACRFLTVDSYFKAVEFYLSYGFEINRHKEYTSKKHYISLRYDLLNPMQ
jgi:ribosomal protein S18 acetylase RimI-like enzyme